MDTGHKIDIMAWAHESDRHKVPPDVWEANALETVEEMVRQVHRRSFQGSPDVQADVVTSQQNRGHGQGPMAGHHAGDRPLEGTGELQQQVERFMAGTGLTSTISMATLDPVERDRVAGELAGLRKELVQRYGPDDVAVGMLVDLAVASYYEAQRLQGMIPGMIDSGSITMADKADRMASRAFKRMATALATLASMNRPTTTIRIGPLEQ